MNRGNHQGRKSTGKAPGVVLHHPDDQFDSGAFQHDGGTGRGGRNAGSGDHHADVRAGVPTGGPDIDGETCVDDGGGRQRSRRRIRGRRHAAQRSSGDDVAQDDGGHCGTNGGPVPHLDPWPRLLRHPTAQG